jgi:hypothetical protein
LLAAFVAALVAGPHSASAYTYQSVATDGCHEELTTASLGAVRATLGRSAARLTPEGDALAQDLPFTLRDTVRDLEAIALLLGVRDNDVLGRNGNDLGDLAEVHGAQDEQRAHCLRGKGDRGEEGAARALAACRLFILSETELAIASLDVSGHNTDLGEFQVVLAIRGKIKVQLPRAYFHLGKALHALQDSFSHTYRSDDGHEVATVLTWLGPLGGEHDEGRDGPGHVSLMDRCETKDARVQARYRQAGEATRALLTAALGPGTSASRSLAVTQALDNWLRSKSGCNLANGYCGSPDAAFVREQASCQLGPTAAAPGAFPLASMFLLTWARRMRSRRKVRS